MSDNRLGAAGLLLVDRGAVPVELPAGLGELFARGGQVGGVAMPRQVGPTVTWGRITLT